MFPLWVAQQAMGYPLLMNLQSNVFYPPFWLFPLFHQTYTLHTAVVFQCLHVLFGALGMYYFARIQGCSKPYALIAGMAYQFFGGFYSNAEHPDIIRGYALLPWLLSGLVVKDKFRATLLIPLFTYLVFTGGYMGQALAALWISLWFILLQFIFRKDISWKISLFRYFLMGLGILLSAVQILPAALLKNEIARAQTYATEGHSFFVIKNFLTSFLWTNAKALPQDISMTTMFVTLPIAGMLFFLTPNRLKENKDYILIFLLSTLMITGSFFYKLVVHLFSPLWLSRFPAADYRAWLAVIMIYLAVISLKDFRDTQNDSHYFKIRFLIFLCVVGYGAYVLLSIDVIALKLSLLTVSLLGFWIFLIKKQKSLLLFSTLIFINGMGTWESDHFLWAIPHINKEYQKDYHIDLATLPALNFKNIAYRPARINAIYTLPFRNNNVPWSGYLTGNFLMTDYAGGNQLRQQKAVQDDPVLSRFMEQKSLLLLLSNDTVLLQKNIDHILETTSLISSPKINMVSYSNNKITYQVDIEKPEILFENEMYFPGWKANLSNGISLSAVLVPPGLRAWRLPAGNYKMVSYFEMPYLHLAIGLSLFGLGIWLLILMRLHKASPKFIATLSP